MKSPLNSIAVHGKYILFLIVSSCRCSLALKPRMDLHAPLTIRNSMLLLLLVLWAQHLERFVGQRFNSDFLYITRVTDGLSRSSSAFSPFSFFTVLSAIMFTVDPLCGWPPVVHTTRGVANNQHERPKRSLFTGPRYNTFFLLLSSWILSPEITI